AACGRASVLEADARRGDPQIRLKVQTPADCPLTLAANFVSIFEGRALSSSGERRVDLFPTYGSLTGMIVPAVTTEIIITPRAPVPLWSVRAMWGGWGLLAIAGWRIGAMAPIRAIGPPEPDLRSPQYPPKKIGAVSGRRKSGRRT